MPDPVPQEQGLRTLSDEQLAQALHETYERLAPAFGYTTRRESAVPWEDVPDQNKRLMIATVRDLRARFGGLL